MQRDELTGRSVFAAKQKQTIGAAAAQSAIRQPSELRGGAPGLPKRLSYQCRRLPTANKRRLLANGAPSRSNSPFAKRPLMASKSLGGWGGRQPWTLAGESVQTPVHRPNCVGGP